MTDFLREWMPPIALVLAPTAGVIAARWNRKSQAEANSLTGSGQVFTHQSTLLQDVQEERTAAVQRADSLVSRVESMDKFMREHFAGYRAYIHTLRGQIHDLGGTPKPWPENLEQ
jgi:hypothetical protein